MAERDKTVEKGENADNPIYVYDDDELRTTNDLQFNTLDNAIRQYRPCQRSHSSAVAIVIDEETQEEELTNEVNNVIDLTADDSAPRRQSRNAFVRLPSFGLLSEPPSQPVPPIHIRRLALPDGRVLKVNFFYEVQPFQRSILVEFVKINSMFEDGATGEITVRGMPYSRNRNLDGQLPRKLNEIFAIYEVDDSDPTPVEEQALVEIPITSVLKPRQVHITNAPFPQHRFHPYHFKSREDVETTGPLVCRWKVFIHFADMAKREFNKPCVWSIVRVRPEDVCRSEYRAEDSLLRLAWRGSTYPGGAYNPPTPLAARNSLVIPTAPEPALRPQTRHPQRYTVFDSFCGAGGASRGAERAGFEVAYAVDSWDAACESHRLNFPRANLFQKDIEQFIQETRDCQIRADVLHLSPPCQVWSPAHTIVGSQDDDNVAALFACRQLIEKIRPRIFTLEQTFGILISRFKLFFDALILGFTDHEYSVTWKIVSLTNYGLPQRRRRLIILGAGPGETLPPWPKHTHSPHGSEYNTRPFVSIIQSLSKIPSGLSDPHHNPVPSRAPMDCVVTSGHSILSRCITTSGGQNRHYSGERAYTNREFACLQGFPVWHKFSMRYAKKQIGNAFPPCVVKVFYEHIKAHLHRTDGIAQAPATSTPPEHNIPIGVTTETAILIDSDEEMTDIPPVPRRASGSAASSTTLSSSPTSTSSLPRGPRRQPRSFLAGSRSAPIQID